MKTSIGEFITVGLCVFLFASCTQATFRDDPTVLVTLLVRNKAHTLPYFLKLFEELDYPKNRLTLWIKSDQNQDQSLEIMNKWVSSVEKSYHHIYHELTTTSPSAVDDKIPTNWTEERFKHIINLREEALDKGRELWADFVWFVDCDVFLTNNQTLKIMVNTNYPVVAPMLDTLSLYSNYWCGMGLDYYYRRTDEYKPIRERENKGCHRVIVVHSCFMVDLRQVESQRLTFKPDKINGYNGPHDDVITFAISGYWTDVPVYICNQIKFGYLLSPLDETMTIEDDYAQLTNIMLEASVDFPTMSAHQQLTEFVTPPVKSTLGFDEIFLINLERRPERRQRMEWSLNQLGLQHKLINAVDGKSLNDSYVASLGIRMLPNFADPYHHRAMTMGEIGCFLSHYAIWQEIVDRQLSSSIIFEDDIRFESNFVKKLADLVNEVDRLKVDWDLIYLGRKRLKHENETWVEGSQLLVNVEYSYWTLSYILSKRGAEKLIKGEPFGQLVPVDEYLPIMFDRHPESRWREAFPNRNLKAFSIAPLLVYPTHYTGEAGYISDTESSEIVPDSVRNASGKDAKTGKGSKEIEIEVKTPKVELPALGETGSVTDTTSASSSSSSTIEEIGKEFHSEL
ncbi:glycosyltransferase 25 family member-like [Daphnia pulicaria]|uniref:glycosyltransferase 25 family member-like n=1 Tax=Daphnia pulicaria TaxID=35523 RepID=UPI001EEAAA4F|nr:glycosyltransferase 25 family member-like [Daphnia pulicaria]